MKQIGIATIIVNTSKQKRWSEKLGADKENDTPYKNAKK